MLGFSGTRSIPRSTISSIKYRSNSSVGNTFYYQVILVTTSSNEIVAASGLLVDDAKWVAEELAKTLGVSSSGESPMNMQRFRRADVSVGSPNRQQAGETAGKRRKAFAAGLEPITFGVEVG